MVEIDSLGKSIFLSTCTILSFPKTKMQECLTGFLHFFMLKQRKNAAWLYLVTAEQLKNI